MSCKSILIGVYIINISDDEEIYQTYIDCYQDLYDGVYPAPVENCLRDMGDILLKGRNDLAEIISEKTDDYISSDKEVSAFALMIYVLEDKYRINITNF